MTEPAFVIIVDGASPEELQQFHERVCAKGTWWWHWFANTWIVAGGSSAADWRDYLESSVIHGSRTTVLALALAEGDAREWAAYGPDAHKRFAFLHGRFTRGPDRRRLVE